MKFVETEEFWNIAVDYVVGANGLREDSIDWDPERLANSIKSLKALLPKTFTKDNPYQVYLDGDLHCNIWHEGDELVCGDYYYLHTLHEERVFKRHETELTIAYEGSRIWDPIKEPRILPLPLDNPSIDFKVVDINYEPVNMVWLVIRFDLLYFPSDTSIRYRIPLELSIEFYDPNEVLTNDRFGNEAIDMFGKIFRRNYKVLIEKLAESGLYKSIEPTITPEAAVKKAREILEKNRKV